MTAGEIKHTAGTWVAEDLPEGARPVISDERGRAICQCSGRNNVANARLIAAAPTLLPAKDIALLDLTISWEPNDTNVHAAASVRWYPPHKSGDDWHAQTAGGRTPALALCIAALRTRSPA